MQIPEGYLEGEIRDGFYVESMMKKTWAAQMEVLAEVDRVCKKNNIQYFADWGTLLGAVRHKGFVPWDDDMDITMKRTDYNRFCNIAEKEMPGFNIVNVHTEPGWDSLAARIVNGKRIRYDKEHLEKFHGCPYVIGLDIFPLDYVAPTEDEDNLQCEMIRILDIFGQMVTKDNQNTPEVLANIHGIEQQYGVNFDYESDIPLQVQILSLSERMRMIYTDADSDRLALMTDHAGPRPADVYPKEYYSDSIYMPFEYIEVPVPVGYDKILRQKYGDGYMIPYIGGTNHEYPFYNTQKRVLYSQLGIEI